MEFQAIKESDSYRHLKFLFTKTFPRCDIGFQSLIDDHVRPVTLIVVLIIFPLFLQFPEL